MMRYRDIAVAWVGAKEIVAMNAWRKQQGKEALENVFEMSSAPGISLRAVVEILPLKVFYLLVATEFTAFHSALKEWCSAGIAYSPRIEIIQTEVKDLSSYQEVYAASEEFFAAHYTPSNANSFCFILDSGTATTQAIMLYLSHVRYPEGRAYEVNDGELCEVSLPCKLSIPKGDSPSLVNEAELDELIRVYAPVRGVHILLLGEHGTGKRELAKEIHRRTGTLGNFVECSCSCDLSLILPNALQRAKNGTIFLSSIDRLSPENQNLLFLFLQEGKILVDGREEAFQIGNIRIISASTENLLEAVSIGKFRFDLYYTLASYVLTLVPVRSLSKERFFRLIDSILHSFGEENPILKKNWNLTEETKTRLRSYLWPGNLYELRHVLFLSCVSASYAYEETLDVNTLRRHMAMQNRCPLILPEEDLPTNLEEWIEQRKSEFISKALRQYKNNKTKVSRRLGISKKKLAYWIAKHGAFLEKLD